MTDRYVTRSRHLTPAEREILECLVEECGEVIQAACKIMRFGPDDAYPGQTEKNTEALVREIGELGYVVSLVEGLQLVSRTHWKSILHVAYFKKRYKLAKYLQHGTVATNAERSAHDHGLRRDTPL